MWRHKINIKKHISLDGSAQKCAAGVIEELRRLRKAEDFKAEIELDEIIDEFEEISEDEKATNDECNEALDWLYDWADDNDVWLGL